MKIVVAGAGQVGRHAAEVLGESGHSVTVIDTSARVLRALDEAIDLKSLHGNCAQAEKLVEAGVADCDLFIAATSNDETNLFSASLAKGVGAKKCLARVHHSTYFSQRGLDYKRYLGIDELLCPEFITAQAIARTLRNPGAGTIENFANGTIQMHKFPVNDDAPAVSKALPALNLPGRTRIVAITRDGDTFIPTRKTVIQRGDVVTLIGGTDTIANARKFFFSGKLKRSHVVIMGGASIAVWLCRALKQRTFAVRLFETKPERAQELAEKLDHITVINADPTDSAVALDERISDADVFVAVTGDDEHNILAAAQAKASGVNTAITVVQRSIYIRLLPHIGIDYAFSPRSDAVREVQRLLETGPVLELTHIAKGKIKLYEVRPTSRGVGVGLPLKEVQFPPQTLVVAIQREDIATVPGADDVIEEGNILLVVGHHGIDRELRKLFVGK
ncbi:MAG: Trk system potassium transporter TrkA [Phycisphaerae bacterium]|nr:Trk system potassium transporter TrkA [Phycisphaerae bacterium]